MASSQEKAAAARALKDAGKTPDDIAELLGVDRATAYRYLKVATGEPEPQIGPRERVARALVAEWGKTSTHQQAVAETLIGFAEAADTGLSSGTGAALGPGVQALKEFKLMLADLGQENDADALRKALLGEDDGGA